MAKIRIIESCTELPQYRRLVEFASEVVAYAVETENEKLGLLCERLANDLLTISNKQQ